MARDKARHKRYEFLFDLEGDSELIQEIAGELRPGYSMADLMRDLLHRRAPETVPHAAAPAHDDTRELWRAIVELKEDIAALQGGVELRPQVLQGDGEQDRQDVLSGKLKKLSFGGLLQ